MEASCMDAVSTFFIYSQIQKIDQINLGTSIPTFSTVVHLPPKEVLKLG